MTSTESLSKLADRYSTEFSECLSTVLPDAPGKINDSQTIEKDITRHINTMKATTRSIEESLQDIRLETLNDKEIALEKSVALLRRDISVKKSTIDKYTQQLQQWSKELQELEDRGRAIATREHEQKRGSDGATNASLEEHAQSSDEDLSDKEMFEV